MIDLHSHALFDIDDGAQTIEDSLDILSRAAELGIDKMALTPHFTVGESVEEFILRRNRRIERLEKALIEGNINIKLCPGAEVYITDELFNETQLDKLTIGNSKAILCEFKYHGLRPGEFFDYIDEVLKNGFIPLVAHPERYSYTTPSVVNEILERGALLQVNAISLFEDGDEGETARALVRSNCAFAIGSDVHHARSRRLDAMERLHESGQWHRMTDINPDKIFENLL